MDMVFWKMAVGSVFAAIVTFFLFMAIVFEISDGSFSALNKYINISMLLLPCLAGGLSLIPWYGYYAGWNKWTYLWFGSPLLIVGLQFIRATILFN